MAWLYVVTCQTTGLDYVGVTRHTPEQRWRRHVYDALAPKNKFHAAIKKYGSSDFVVSGLFLYPSLDEALEAETVLIDALQLIDNGYNTARGGIGGAAMTGRSHTEATKKKISLSATGRVLDAATRAKISETKKGVNTLGMEGIRQMAAQRRGASLTDSHRAAIAAAATGRIMSPEARRKMSEAALRRYTRLREAA